MVSWKFLPIIIILFPLLSGCEPNSEKIINSIAGEYDAVVSKSCFPDDNPCDTTYVSTLTISWSNDKVVLEDGGFKTSLPPTPELAGPNQLHFSEGDPSTSNGAYSSFVYGLDDKSFKYSYKQIGFGGQYYSSYSGFVD